MSVAPRSCSVLFIAQKTRTLSHCRRSACNVQSCFPRAPLQSPAFAASPPSSAKPPAAHQPYSLPRTYNRHIPAVQTLAVSHTRPPTAKNTPPAANNPPCAAPARRQSGHFSVPPAQFVRQACSGTHSPACPATRTAPNTAIFQNPPALPHLSGQHKSAYSPAECPARAASAASCRPAVKTGKAAEQRQSLPALLPSCIQANFSSSQAIP